MSIKRDPFTVIQQALAQKRAELAMGDITPAGEKELILRGVTTDEEALAIEQLFNIAYTQAAITDITQHAKSVESLELVYKKFKADMQPEKITVDGQNAYLTLPEGVSIAALEKEVANIKDWVIHARPLTSKAAEQLGVTGNHHYILAAYADGNMPEIVHQIGMDCAIKCGNALAQIVHHYGFEPADKIHDLIQVRPKVPIRDNIVSSMLLIDDKVYEPLVKALSQQRAASR